jgi:hypothetical protein
VGWGLDLRRCEVAFLVVIALYKICIRNSYHLLALCIEKVAHVVRWRTGFFGNNFGSDELLSAICDCRYLEF